MLYIHIPFCDSKCPYCAFNSFVSASIDEKAYLSAIFKQFERHKSELCLKEGEFESMYIGGGTPSVMSSEFYALLFERFLPYLKGDAEITIEANPNSASLKWLSKLRGFGANRLSLGAQSLNNEKLKFLGRIHSASDAVTAVKNGRKAGFANISVDLIYDTIFDDERFLKEELRAFIALGCEHISAYSLTIEDGTPFEKMAQNRLRQSGDGLGKYVAKTLNEAFFPQYEVSSFGAACSKHNSGYWRHKSYLGLGAGAVGFWNNSRLYPQKSIQSYTSNPTLIKKERLSEGELITEKIFLGFRSVVGVEKSILTPNQLKKIDTLINEKMVYEKDNRLFVYDFFLADELALFLI